MILILLISFHFVSAQDANYCKKIDGIYRSGTEFKVISDSTLRTVTYTGFPKINRNIHDNNSNIISSGGNAITAAFETNETLYLVRGSNVEFNDKSGVPKSIGVSDLYTSTDFERAIIRGAAFIPARNAVRYVIEGYNSGTNVSIRLQVETDMQNRSETFRHVIQIQDGQRGNENEFHKEIAHIRTDSVNDYFIVIWGSPGRGQFWAEQVIPISYKTPADRVLRFDMEKYDYRPVSHWHGCPQDLCLEGQIDTALLGSDSKIYLYREYQLYKLGEFSPSSPYGLTGSVLEQVDSSFMVNGREYKIIEGKFEPPYQGKELPSEVFPNFKFKNIDAVLVKDSNFHVFSGKYVTFYSMDSTSKFKFINQTLINKLWTKVWTKLDSALYHPKEKASYFFLGDFHIRVPDDSPSSGEIELNQGILWMCPDPRYSDRMSDHFDIHGYKQFVEKIVPIRKRKLEESLALSDDDQMIAASGTKLPQSKSSNIVIILVVILVAILAIGIIIALIICCAKKRKTSTVAAAPANAPNKSASSSISSSTPKRKAKT